MWEKLSFATKKKCNHKQISSGKISLKLNWESLNKICMWKAQFIQDLKSAEGFEMTKTQFAKDLGTECLNL